MKSFLILAALVAVAVAETYPTDYDSLDIDSIAADPVALKNISDCYLDKGDCSEMGKFFKGYLQDASDTACAKCTAPQKTILKKYLEAVKKTSPEVFDELKKKYDPLGKNIDKLRAALADA
uniref:Chemosensory protein 16 n=1 Tax=Heortia vitessoides TaxID=1557813 RepID=A0A978W7C2_9NEOP|nr:chemosensory protein 16 [Heortia vitessoides]